MVLTLAASQITIHRDNKLNFYIANAFLTFNRVVQHLKSLTLNLIQKIINTVLINLIHEAFRFTYPKINIVIVELKEIFI